MNTGFTIPRCGMLLAGFLTLLLAIHASAAVTTTLDAAATRTTAGITSYPLTTSSSETVYLRFKVDGIMASGSVITKVTLRLYRTSGTDPMTIRAANNSRSDSDWLLWWNTAGSLDSNPPHLANSVIVPTATTTNGNWVEFDITDQYVTGDGLYSFAVTSSGTNTYAPKNDTNAPQLVIDDSVFLDKATYTSIELLEQGPRIAARYDITTSGTINTQSYYSKYGVIDATKQPYGAKPGDNADDRLAIQRAINDARLARAVVYLPWGTYLVSDTIEMVQGSVDRYNFIGRRINPTDRNWMIGRDPAAPTYAGADVYFERWTNAREFGNALMAQPGARATLKLMDTAAGFTFDPDLGTATPLPPKPVLKIWSRWNAVPDVDGDGRITESDFTAAAPNINTNKNQLGINYNQTVSNIDIDLNAIAGGRNRGAAGVTTGTAQGGVISDCTITATNAFAGLFGSAGPGGGIHNVTVSGGQYGLCVSQGGDGQQVLISACRFVGQTTKAILWNGLGGITLVGTNITGKGIQVNAANAKAPWNGMLCLVDSKIDLTFPDVAIVSNRSVYMNRVYVKNGNPVITPDPNLPAPGNAILAGSGWIRFNEYAGGVSIDQNPFDSAANPSGVPYYLATADGAMIKTDNATLVDSVNVGAGVDLSGYHAWPDTPWFLDSENPNSNVISVTAYGAKGDGVSDDTAAIQQAIDYAHQGGKNVFIPKGDFRISQSLHLKGAVRLFGIHKNYTSVQSMYSDGVRTGNDFYGTAANAKPLIVADAGGTGMLSDLALVQRLTDARSYLLDWKASPASVVKNVTFLRRPMEGTIAQIQPSETPMILVEGAGTGGRFFHLWGVASSQKEPYSPARHLKVRDTTGKLALYMVNFEYAHNLPQMEIVGASNVDIYQTKFEGNYRNLQIRNSSNIRVFGVGGNACPFPSDIQNFTYPASVYYNYNWANQNIWIENTSPYLIAGQSYQGRKPDPVIGYEAQQPADGNGIFPDVNPANGINDNEDVYATALGASTDPAKYDRLKENALSGAVTKTPGSEQFVLFKRGDPLPLFP